VTRSGAFGELFGWVKPKSNHFCEVLRDGGGAVARLSVASASPQRILYVDEDGLIDSDMGSSAARTVFFDALSSLSDVERCPAAP